MAMPAGGHCHSYVVIAGLVPATHGAAAEVVERVDLWVPGTSPGMTVGSILQNERWGEPRRLSSPLLQLSFPRLLRGPIVQSRNEFDHGTMGPRDKLGDDSWGYTPLPTVRVAQLQCATNPCRNVSHFLSSLTSIHSSGLCACSMLPGPQTTAGMPACWNNPASVQ